MAQHIACPNVCVYTGTRGGCARAAPWRYPYHHIHRQVPGLEGPAWLEGKGQPRTLGSRQGSRPLVPLTARVFVCVCVCVLVCVCVRACVRVCVRVC